MTAQERLRRFQELAVSRLLGELTPEEAQECEELQSRIADDDIEGVERTVALAHLALLSQVEPIPDDLRAVVHREAEVYFCAEADRHVELPESSPPARRSAWTAAAGWIVAVAASCVALVLMLDRPITQRPPEVRSPISTVSPPPRAQETPRLPTISNTPPPAINPGSSSPRVALDIATQRRMFLATHPHAILRAWRSGGDPTGERVRGDVVWDQASQTGYMRFENLRLNEPNREQYQLWIFDGTRDERYPVDGGLFNVAAREGEVVVPIHAALQVRAPLAFAVTVEHPGGVVVSDRSRVAVIANIS